MLLKIYHLGLLAYHAALRTAAIFHPKARLWVDGRRGWRSQLRKSAGKSTRWIWFHAASLGEFEQGRPLIELLRQQYPHYSILLSFFSPSGYEVRKNYPLADAVCYLPLDHPGNARDFLDILRPELVVFIKYELWLNYLSEIRQREIPAILIAASLTAESRFLRSRLAPYYKEAFLSFRAIFTQDEQTLRLLQQFTAHPQLISSKDTRYDRVLATRQAAEALPEIADFVGKRLCLVAGSSWPQSEEILLEAFLSLKAAFDICLIFAPHEIKPGRIQKWMQHFPAESHLLSEGPPPPEKSILWIDQIGLLSRLYRYADIAWIGGALGGHGLHNVLEATAFGVPVLFGPRHGDKPEALALLEMGGAFAVQNGAQLQEVVMELLASPERREALKEKLQAFVEENSGASRQVLGWIRSSGFGVSGLG